MNKPSHEYCKDCKDWNGSIVNCMEICSIPINIIEEWEKYHAIGTLEECRAAVEKQKAKKPMHVTNSYFGYQKHKEHVGYCPDCGHQVEEPYGCPNCLRKIDWSDGEWD